ncbi:uncharacterized protein LOC116160326 [Photinus pyralis]|uniref:uncharacterized protein LOC116160326 n=1 Tax=Photinus pyralis TaxID=7054 RepID=UPI00126770CC|nr:uncharacterized protein LOC116160326 [Photinus pyralis]
MLCKTNGQRETGASPAKVASRSNHDGDELDGAERVGVRRIGWALLHCFLCKATRTERRDCAVPSGTDSVGALLYAVGTRLDSITLPFPLSAFVKKKRMKNISLETRGKSAEDLTNLILSKLDKDGLDIQNCRGQTYDNAAVMSGVHSGVQKLGVHAASISVDSVTFFGTLERIYAFFSFSSHRWTALLEKTGRGVKRLVETRWSSREEATSVIKNNFEDILDVLESLSQSSSENASTRSDAGILYNAMQTLPFMSYLGLWSAILPEINSAQVYLQGKGRNLHDCVVKILALKTWLVEKREDLVTGGSEYARKICEKLCIDLAPRRICRRKRMDDGNPVTIEPEPILTFEQKLELQLYKSVDKIIEEITSRFKQLQELDNKFSLLTPSNLLDPNFACDLQHAPSDIDQDEFRIERERLRHFIEAGNEAEALKFQGPLELLQFIQQFGLADSVPNIVVYLRIFLTLAISVATCERSFSKLKLIKDYLRSAMSQLRLSNLAILSIEHELTNAIDFNAAMDEFAALKARKIKF